MLKRVKIIFILLIYASVSFASNSIHDSAIMNVTIHNANPLEIDKYITLSDSFLKNDHKLAIKYARLGTSIAIKTNNKTILAKCTYNEGVGFSRLGLFNTAFDKLNESKTLYIHLFDTLKIIEITKEIGNLFWFQQSYTDALKYYKEAEQLSNISTRKELLSSIYTNIGVSFYSLNKNDSAIIYYNKAITIEKKDSNDYQIGMIYLNLGAYYEKWNHDSATYYYNKALLKKHALQNSQIAYTHASLAKILVSNKKFNQANKNLKLALFYAEKEDNLMALREYYKIKFKLDSSLKNNTSALKSHIKYKEIEDSIHSLNFFEKNENYKTLYELSEQEKEIDLLKIENAFYKENVRKKQYIILLFVFISIMSIILLFIYYKFHQEKKKAIIDLRRKNEELFNNKEELTILNNEILLQREEVFQKNRKLKETINKIHQAQAQIIQSEKLATIGILASGVAHEINNPLIFINNGLDKLSEFIAQNNLNDEQKTNLQKLSTTIKEGTLKAQNIIEVLGSINHATKDQKVLCDINNIINNTLKLFKYKLSGNIELIENYGKFNEFYSLPEKLQTIAIQLISNAIEASEKIEKKGVKYIKIATWDITELDQRKIFLTIENAGEHLSKESLKNIFDPFFSTKELKKSEGLGLFVTQNQLKEINGNISVENSTLGVVFKIEIVDTPASK